MMEKSMLGRETTTRDSRPDTCTMRIIHKDIVESVAQKMPHQLALLELADFFKLFSDGTRISILCALSESEMCVCDLCALLNMKQSAISHQLRNLKQARIVRFRRDGKSVYYALDDEHIRDVLKVGMTHVCEPPERSKGGNHDDSIPY